MGGMKDIVREGESDRQEIIPRDPRDKSSANNGYTPFRSIFQGKSVRLKYFLYVRNSQFRLS